MGKFRDIFAKSYRQVDPREAQEATDRGDAVLVDVREPHEWQNGHAPNARHIPLAQLSARLAVLPEGREVILVCRSGHRSGQAARMVGAQRGDVANLRGGMNAWARSGLPVVAKGGGPGRVV